MKKFILGIFVVGGIIAWFLTAPTTVNQAEFENLDGNAEKGALVFAAAGCSSCRAAPDAKAEDKLILSGGLHFKSDFGTFIAPNISPSDEGLAGWSVVDLANAMLHGTSPAGQHYYPAFPYTSYKHMPPAEIADLHAKAIGITKFSEQVSKHYRSERKR